MGNKFKRIFRSQPITEKEINFIKSLTGFEREIILEQHANFLKKYPEGLMDEEDFVSYYRQLYPKGNAEKYSKSAFKAFDKDDSGFINFKEFLISCSYRSLSKCKNLDSVYDMAFEVYDQDGNGVIDKHELESLFVALSELIGSNESQESVKERVEQVFENYDQNSDGYLNKSEFVKFMIYENRMEKLIY